MQTIRRVRDDYRNLLRSVPSMVTTVFILSVVFMNLMASKELYRSEYFCLNCGLALSWISFLCMDCICKRFGPKAATKISILAIGVNVVCVIVLKLLSMAPGNWAAFYSASDAATGEMITKGIDSTFGGAWYVVVGSAVAGALSMAFQCTLRAPHGGIFVIPTIGHPAMFLLALLVGSIVGAILLGVLRKPAGK